MTPEGRVKKAVKKVLNDLGAYHFWPVQTGMGKRTVDCLVCYRGRFFGIETKAPGGEPTKLQEVCMREIGAAGGEAIVIDSVEKSLLLKHWLISHSDEWLGKNTEEIPT